MKLHTLSGEHFEMGLTRTSQQYAFTPQVFKDIAMRTPLGVELSKQASEQWSHWVKAVNSTQDIIKMWKNTDVWMVDGVDGLGVAPGKVEHGKLAADIWGSAIWGYGVLGWATFEEAAKSIKAMRKPREGLKGSACPCRVKEDYVIYMDCGIMVPLEYGLLWRWLKSLCQ